MLLSEITSREAVLNAIGEFDQLGKERFLEKYQFGPARSFFLEHDGRRYDSKAIVGAAYGYQFPERGPLASNEFSGGEATVRAVLERLGFSVSNSNQTLQQPVGPEIEDLLEQLPVRRKEPFGGHDRPFSAWCHNLYYDEALARDSTWDIRTRQRLNLPPLTISTHSTDLEQKENISIAGGISNR
jgi:hypothetical protein